MLLRIKKKYIRLSILFQLDAHTLSVRRQMVSDTDTDFLSDTFASTILAIPLNCQPSSVDFDMPPVFF